jgi:hypothetical protein
LAMSFSRASCLPLIYPFTPVPTEQVSPLTANTRLKTLFEMCDIHSWLGE